MTIKSVDLSRVWLPKGRGEEIRTLRESARITWTVVSSEQIVISSSCLISVPDGCVLYSHVCFHTKIIVGFGFFSKPNIHTLQILLKDALGSSCGFWSASTMMCASGCSTSSWSGSQQELSLVCKVGIEILILFLDKIVITFLTQRDWKYQQKMAEHLPGQITLMKYRKVAC